MSYLHEVKKQRTPSGVQYIDDVDYAEAVTKKDVPEAIVNAIEGDPVKKTNRGVLLSMVPGEKCGCFGGKIHDPKDGECPWLYIFIPPTIPNPKALDYTSRRGHPPANEIPNMTHKRKRELRDLCDKYDWELNTEDLWGDDVVPSQGDTPEASAFYTNMSKLKKDGWYSWTIAPKGNFDKPEKWEVAIGQQNAADAERWNHYNKELAAWEADSPDDIVAVYGNMRRGDDDFSGYGRVTESTKVTLTIGQIKRLIKESRIAEEKEGDEEIETPAVPQFYGLYNDGGNCWSRGSCHPQWYWAKSWADEGETRSEFLKRLKRMGRRKAEENYYEYVDAGSYGAKVFSNWNDFERAARRVGLNPEKPREI